MKIRIVNFALISFGLIGCSQKPKPVAQSEPQPPALAQAKPQASPDSMESHRLRIQALLNKAFQPIYFPYDKASLSEESKSLLAEAGSLMKQESSIKVLIQGNTDERGTPEYNLALGDKRARTVKQYLVSYGIDSSRLQIISYGEEKPSKSGHDESAWALNRRDEFNVTF